LAAFKVIYAFDVYDSANGKWPVWVENFADSLAIKYEE
jgi:hypothetical protein